MRKYIAEFVGTFTLVLLGCGAAVLRSGAAAVSNPPAVQAVDQIGFLGIAFAFGLALIAMAYGIGPISGCHINPAVTLGVFTAGRMSSKDVPGYLIGQFLGGIAAAAVLAVIAGSTVHLGQNGYADGSPGHFGLGSGVVFEFVATLIFLIAILGATGKKGTTPVAGLAIGLTLVVIHIVGIPVTGVSVNPARKASARRCFQAPPRFRRWMFLIVPSAGGLVGGLLFRAKILEE